MKVEYKNVLHLGYICWYLSHVYKVFKKNIHEQVLHFEYRLPIEVIGHGELSTGSDVYTMAMLFYEFFMAISGNDRLQSIPFSYKHRSQVGFFQC